MEAQTSTPPGRELPADFDDRLAAWHKAVAGVFARVMRKDVADVDPDVWKKLIKTTYDGIDVRPLYTRADDLAEVAEPGVFPFVRGAAVADKEKAGWGVTETVGAWGKTPAEVNKHLLNALFNGTTDVVVDLTGDIKVEDLSQVFAEVLLDLVPIRLKAGDKTTAAVTELFALIDDAGVAESSRVEFGCAPLTADVDKSPSPDLDETLALAKLAVARPGTIRSIMVDGVSLSNQGATDAQEIGWALAAGVDYIRLLTESGLSSEQALEQLSFRFAANDDQFAQIAKFRASRGLWARVAEVIGYPELGSAPQHAMTAPAMFSQRDPWVNMLRCTVAAFAGGVGGATDVEILPFDAAVKEGLDNTSRSFAYRIARNTNLLLLEESHLGFVVDPGGGSYYIEQLTDELADKAWDIFQQVEKAGGYRKAKEAGLLQQALDASFETLRDDVAHRRKKVTGINEFPNLGEKPLPADKRVEPAGVRRWAAEFEALRNRSDAYLDENGARPTATLIPLGPLAKHNVRTGFATNLLASGGIEAINPGQLVPGTEEFTAAAKDAKIVVICGADGEYTESGCAAVKALREAGAEVILAAGQAKTFDCADTPDDYLNMTIDAAATLADLLDTLGA